MKDRMPTWVYDVAHSASKIPYVKTLLKPLYYPIKGYFNKRRNKHFKANALEVLKQFDLCMQENGYNYSLLFGTLLGAIREHGFISHDFDIDVALFIEDRSSILNKRLEEKGFHLSHRFIIDDGRLGCEETYIYKDTGVSIDIFFICKAIDEYPYVCCWNYGDGCATYRDTMKKYNGVVPRRIELPISQEIMRINFETIEVNIFKNAHQISEYCYGPKYMTPDPNYVAPTEHRVVWTEKLARFEEF